MARDFFSYNHLLTVSLGVLAMALIATPVQFDSGDLIPSKSIVFAKGGGGGGNGGGGGGDGGDNGGGNGGGGSHGGGGDDGGGNGASSSTSNGGGKGGGKDGDKGGGKSASSSTSNGGGHGFGRGGHTSHNTNHNPNIASKLKGLNAAHANYNGYYNAAPGSRVGLLAAYKAAAEATLAQQAVVDAIIAAGGVPTAAQLQAVVDAAAAEAAALDAAANKNPDNKNVDTTDVDVIAAIRSLLGL